MSATTMRPGRVQTRAISRSTASGSGKWWNANRDTTTENDRSGNGSGSTLPTCQSTLVRRERCRMLARLVDHRGSQIDAGRAPADLRERRDHQSRAACHIEHGVRRARAGEFDQQPQRVLVAHRGRVRERRRLAGELVDDGVGVGGHVRPGCCAL